ncbi:MAG: hypothetical protein V4548_04415 [Bacteroidota bacterium]
MKGHYIIDPGMMPINDIYKDLVDFSKSQDLILLTERRRQSQFKIFEKNIPILFYENFQAPSKTKLHKDFHFLYQKALLSVLEDNRTFLLAERVNRISPLNSVFNQIPIMEQIVYNMVLLHQEKPIHAIIFQATPHNLPNWIMAKVAEVIGIKVQMIQTSPLPWRYWIVEGLDVQKNIFPKNIVVSEIDKSYIQDYVELNRRNYSEALPDYEKKRLEKGKGKFWSWRREFTSGVKNKKAFLSLPYKKKIYDLYQTLTIEPNKGDKYLVFFLHFQPERTSMPEAFEFSNQWLIIRMISNSLPTGWKLYVKEHPSMFTNYFDIRYRNKSFYNNIAELDNTQLLSLESDTFDLIDNAQGVVTITGTVGVQALVRGKPVFTFGVSSYRGLKNVYVIRKTEDLNLAFEAIKEPYQTFSNNEFIEVAQQSISGVDLENEYGISPYDSKIRSNGHIRLLKEYLLNERAN